MIKCLAHICIEAVDLKKTQWFYCDVLGFTKKFDFIKDGVQLGFYLQINESNFIEVFKAGENREAPQRPRIKHFCLEVEDIDAVEKQLTENGIKTRGNKIVNVQTNRGVIETEKVVNACGPWSQVPSKWVGLELPVQPLRRQWLVTNKITQFPKSFPFVIDFAASLYFHREGPGILTGMSNPHQPFGEDQNIDTEWENNHVEKAVQRMPLLAKAGIKARC